MKYITSTRNILYVYYLTIIFTPCVIRETFAQADPHPYETVADACSKCNCTTKEDSQPFNFYVLNCTARNFSQILAGYPEIFHLTETDTQLDMSFSGNKISFLNQLPSTQALVFFSCRHCGIKEMHAEVFLDVPHIYKVDLSWNELKDLTPDIFKGPYKTKAYNPIGLVELDLSHNLLETLESNVFEHLPILKILKLSHNPLNFEQDPKMAALVALPKIEQLNLAFTGIATLSAEILSQHLIELNIYGNKFETVPDSLANAGGTLKSLNIGGNLIKEIYDESFSGLHSLKYLHMNDMGSLERIHQGAFANLTALEFLYCFNNFNITSINIGSLYSSQNLKIIDISNCSLNTLELVYVNSSQPNDNDTLMFSNLNLIKIENNPWHCNCSLFKTLQKLIKFDENDFQSENTARCSTPYELTSDLLVDITVDTLCLVSNNKKQREPVYDPPPFLRPRSILFSLISILIVVLIGLCIGFAIVLIKKKLKKNEIGFASPIRYTTVRNSTISVG